MVKKNQYWLLVSAMVLVIDQLTKYLVIQHMAQGQSIVLLPVFNLYHTVNQGAAFSLLGSSPTMALWLFSGVAVFVSAAILVWLFQSPSQKTALLLALSLILGGAIGNLLDRIRLQHVIDFLQLHVGEYYWPVFNVADMAIVAGAILLVIDAIWGKESS